MNNWGENVKPAECLSGLILDDDWTVLEIIEPGPNATGGHFSVGYLVENSIGKKAFLKALDFSAAFQEPDFTRALQDMTTAYNFERDILIKCKGRRMSRVTTPILQGEVGVKGNFGPLNKVCYLIFEIAEGDIRNEIEKKQAFDNAWCLRALHHIAIGLWQLHKAGIAHQDIKPSNVLFFKKDGSKVSDLGRASDVNLASAVDGCSIPGDTGYAPPEQYYRRAAPPDFEARKAADMYHLGSMIFFLFAQCSASAAIKAKLGQAPGLNQCNGENFEHDLPYIKFAFNQAIEGLKEEIIKKMGVYSYDLIEIARELCEPDASERGDMKNKKSLRSQYDLERYISRLNILAKRSEKLVI